MERKREGKGIREMEASPSRSQKASDSQVTGQVFHHSPGETVPPSDKSSPDRLRNCECPDSMASVLMLGIV